MAAWMGPKSTVNVGLSLQDLDQSERQLSVSEQKMGTSLSVKLNSFAPAATVKSTCVVVNFVVTLCEGLGGRPRPLEHLSSRAWLV